MFDFIPLYLYTPIFNYLILLLVVGVFIKTQAQDIYRDEAGESYVGFFLACAISLYMGLRPISGYYFGDTANYAQSYEALQRNMFYEIDFSRDWLFDAIMWLFTLFTDVHGFFLFCALVYMLALYAAMRNFFGYRYYIPFIVAMSMFTFWSYGTNGIRNGMASSIAILALSYRPRYNIMILLAAIAMCIHMSMGVTLMAAFGALFVRDHKLYLGFWVFAIISSLIGGQALANMITSIGFIGTDVMDSYMNSTEYLSKFSQTGFRWDFLLYSSIPVAVASYFIFNRDYQDTTYSWLFNIYLVTNAFWIIFMESAFSNRFAQISWFVMPLVLIYPFVSQRFWSDQSRRVGIAVVAFYLFTFYFNILSV